MQPTNTAAYTSAAAFVHFFLSKLPCHQNCIHVFYLNEKLTIGKT
jgi:hypothetical protein